MGGSSDARYYLATSNLAALYYRFGICACESHVQGHVDLRVSLDWERLRKFPEATSCNCLHGIALEMGWIKELGAATHSRSHSKWKKMF